MIYTWCFQKIAPSTLEKSCKGEHGQQGGEEGEWEFPCGAKGVCVGLCLPLGSSEPPPLTLHAHPLRLTPGLAHFGGWGSLCSLCICGRGGSPQPWPWRWSSVPGGGCLPSWAAHDLWIQQSLKACFSGASVHTTHPSGALWAVSQYLWGSHRAPCSEGLSFTLPLPHFPYGRTVLYCDFSHRRYWKQEDERAKKNGQKPSLKKAIIKCYWKSYLLSAIFVFSEVKAFTYSALLSLYMGQYWNGCDWWERPVV